MIVKVKSFFEESYRLSPIAFYCEMVEAVFLIAASAILSFTILDPATNNFCTVVLSWKCVRYRKCSY